MRHRHLCPKYGLNRRTFLKGGVAAAFAPSLPLLHSQIPRPLPKDKSIVAAIRGENLNSMTRDAIDAIGGIHTIVDKDETVFIKPNFVNFPWAQHNNCFHTGDCTKPEILIAVAEECLKAGAAEVVIGEGSQLPQFDWRHAVTLDGETNLVREANRLTSLYDGKVTLACLETDSPSWVEVPSQTRHGKIAVSSLVANADKVISIPVAKTHSWAQLTLATKNFLGVTPLSRYAQFIAGSFWNRGSFDHSSPQAIAQPCLDIVKGVQPDLTIIDFSIGIEADGPTKDQGGITVDMKDRLGSWAILASTDIMAADASAARIMNHDVSKVRQLSMGLEMGLGEIREEAIEITGEKLDDLRVEWKPARIKGHAVADEV
jgi:uncharacterized protein (DUF362 family)